MPKIKEIERFNIKKAQNGFVIEVEYHTMPEDGHTYSLTRYATVVANNRDEVASAIEEWFSAVVPQT